MNLKLPTLPLTPSKPEDEEPTCRICGSTENIMLSGFCFDCEEELEMKSNKGKRSTSRP
jgi:hypothetical protein